MLTLTGKNSLIKSFIILFLISLFIIPCDNLYSAKQYEGSKIKVYSYSKKYTGNFLSVTEKLIVIKEKHSKGILGFPVKDIKKVIVGKKSKAGKGILIGAGIGVIIAGGLLLLVPKEGDNLGEVLGNIILIGVAVTAGIVILGVLSVGGGIIGAIFGKGKKFKLGKINAEKRAEALQKLAEYAFYGSVIPGEIKSQIKMIGEN